MQFQDKVKFIQNHPDQTKKFIENIPNDRTPHQNAHFVVVY